METTLSTVTHGQVVSSHYQHANLPRLYKIRKEPMFDPGTTMHQQAGTGIWHCDMSKKALKNQKKKVVRDKRKVNW
jgi:hypothetical protein